MYFRRYKYSYAYLYKYIPQKYDEGGNDGELVRQVVYRFKDGNVDDDILSFFVEKIKSVMYSSFTRQWVIAFIPASDWRVHIIRYERLAHRLEEATSLSADINAITDASSGGAKHLGLSQGINFYQFNSSYFKDKNVFLIDDIITTGTSFKTLMNCLRERGAREVFGLFVAKTYHENKNNPSKPMPMKK